MNKELTVEQLQLSQIGQIAVPVTDLARAVAFYRDTLGMKFLFQVPNLAFFDCAGVRLMLDMPQDSKEHHSFVIYYKVDDIEAAYRLLVSRDVGFEDKPHMIAKMPDHELWMTFFRDPDRNLLALMSEVRHSAAGRPS
jgi:catechol 2,3-dioxygenase-like lactoylglutathione lyase family enzyme